MSDKRAIIDVFGTENERRNRQNHRLATLLGKLTKKDILGTENERKKLTDKTTSEPLCLVNVLK